MFKLSRLRKIDYKRGATHTLEVLVVTTLLLFFMIAPIAYYIVLHGNMALNSIFNTTLQNVSVSGGLGNMGASGEREVVEVLINNLIHRGIISEDEADGVLVEIFNSDGDLLAGDATIYRYHPDGSLDDAMMHVRVTVPTTGLWGFWNNVQSLLLWADTEPIEGRIRIIEGWVLSQRPRVVG